MPNTKLFAATLIVLTAAGCSVGSEPLGEGPESATQSTAEALTYDCDPGPYDVDGDGALTDADTECITQVALAMLGKAPSRPPSCLALGLRDLDYSQDGAVTVTDVLHVAKAVEGAESCALYGDLTGNGSVTVADLQCMTLTMQWAVNPDGAEAPGCLAHEEAADLNCNGEINVVDYQLAVPIVLGNPLDAAIDADSNGIHDDCE